MTTITLPARAFARVIVSVSLATCTLLANAAPASLALFGTQLKGASRTELRQTLIKAGLRPQRVDSSYFCDEYGVNGKLKGASLLTVCYTEGDNRFASAQYTFPGFMNMQLVQRVWKTQPFGGFVGDGTSPSRMIRSFLRSGLVVGIAERRACV